MPEKRKKGPFGRFKKLRLRTTQIIALAFAGIILLGTGLLLLPLASRSGVSCGLPTALFTATSATCVTGLTRFDTWSQFNGFGQTVVICTRLYQFMTPLAFQEYPIFYLVISECLKI